MRNFSLFQLVALGICAALVVTGVMVFAMFNRSAGAAVGKVTIWGTLPQHSMDILIQTLRGKDASFQNVSYAERPETDFSSALLNAIASGQAPDLVMLSQEEIVPFRDKLQVIPYETVTQSAYQSAFVGEANLFLMSSGVLAMPFTLDPLVMYWNTDRFATAGIATAPKYWDELLAATPKLTVLTAGGDIGKSMVAMGTWDNVRSAKAILMTLTMQAGDPIIAADASGKLRSVYGGKDPEATEVPAASALRFYTDFADPSKTSYSWNRTRPSSLEAFAAGDLAVYLGFASEHPAIAARNPNLHFAVAPLPQVKGSPAPLTYGRLTGLAIPRGSRNPRGAAVVAQLLTMPVASKAIAESMGLPPVRRDLIRSVPDNAAKSAFMQSALIAKGWLDPDQGATDRIFESMVESVLSGENEPTEAVSEAAQALQRLFR